MFQNDLTNLRYVNGNYSLITLGMNIKENHMDIGEVEFFLVPQVRVSEGLVAV